MTLLHTMETEQRRRALSQWFTPLPIASHMWAWAWNDKSPAPLRVLEPACGRGALLEPIKRFGIITRQIIAYDIDPANVAHVEAAYPHVEVDCYDFLEIGIGQFDISVYNPPYEDGNDAAFAEKICTHCRSSVGIFRNVFLHGKERSEKFWRWHDIRRMAILSKRPHFGGDHGAKTDFVVLDLRRRKLARKQGEPCTANVEWW